jgi:nitroreductase / dihydropteridine reductase
VELTKTYNSVVDALKWRYAVKQFDPLKKLSENQLNAVLDALMLTPTSMGLQLMKFLVVENANLRTKIREKSYHQMQVEDASHLIVLCRKSAVTEQDIETYIHQVGSLRQIDPTSESLNGFRAMLYGAMKMEINQQVSWLENQVYIALGNLLTVCAVEKIDACPMEGFDRQAVDELLGLPKMGIQSVLMCPIGFRASNDKYASLAKVRRSKSDLITFI